MVRGREPLARLAGDWSWGGDVIKLSLVADGEIWRLSESHVHCGLAGG